jgi:hypothetical protein
MDDKLDNTYEPPDVDAPELDMKMPRKRIRKIKRDGSGVMNPLVVPSIDAVINDAVAILASEINVLKTKSLRVDRPNLTKEEASLLNRYIKSLVELSKEEREIEKTMALSGLSGEELLDMARSSIGKIEHDVKVAKSKKPKKD